MYEELLEERHHGIAVLGNSGELIAANHLFKEITGYIEHDNVGLDVGALDDGSLGALASPQGELSRKSVKTDLTKRDGSSILVIVSAKALKARQGDPPAYIVCTDHGSDALGTGTGAVAQSVQDMGQFGHDLRNVFTAIVGGVRIMMEAHSDDQEIQRRLVNLEMAVESGLKILERLHNRPRN